MPAYYTYFISTLPGLYFGMPSPFAYERFLQMSEGLITQKDLVLLKNLPLNQDQDRPFLRHPVIKKWLAFDTTLRNELVKARAHRKHADAECFLRPDPAADAAIIHLAMTAYRNVSIMDAEKTLDQARWQFLDDLSTGHYFDNTSLIIYAYKLLILLRWDRINRQDPQACLEETLGEL